MGNGRWRLSLAKLSALPRKPRGAMTDNQIPPERWTEILAHNVRTGKLVPIIQWLFLRIDEPEVRAKIDALPKAHSAKVVAAIARVAHEWETTGVVSEQAVFEFSRNGWWLPEVFPILPPELRKVAEVLLSPHAQLRQ